MRFLFSLISLASIAGALMMLYVGAGSFLKLNQSSDEEKALATERAAAMVTRIAQRNGALANAQVNGNPSFGLLNFGSWSLPPAAEQPESATPSQPHGRSGLGDEFKGVVATTPKPPAVQPLALALTAAQMFSAPTSVPPMPRIIPRRTPTPADEAWAVYRKYATPQ